MLDRRVRRGLPGGPGPRAAEHRRHADAMAGTSTWPWTRGQILAWHTTGASNGPTEGLNSVIKKVKRVGAGFRSFATYRLRISDPNR